MPTIDLGHLCFVHLEECPNGNRVTFMYIGYVEFWMRWKWVRIKPWGSATSPTEDVESILSKIIKNSLWSFSSNFIVTARGFSVSLDASLSLCK